MQENKEMEENQIEYSPSKEEIIEYAKYLGMDIQNDQKYLYIAEEGLRATLPEGWKEYITPQGQIYYYNQTTQMSQWEHPSDEFYKQKYQQEKNKDQYVQRSLQDFVEHDIQEQQKPIQPKNVKQSYSYNQKNTPIVSNEESTTVDQRNNNQIKIQTPISQASLGRQTPKQEYYEYNNNIIEEKLNEYEMKKMLETKEAIANIEVEFEERKNQIQQQVDNQIQQFLQAWEGTNAQNKDSDQIDIQKEKEQILQQLKINFNEQKIVQENKLKQKFNDIKDQIQATIEVKYQTQIEKLETQKREFDDINQNKSFLNISQKNINTALIAEQQKMKQYYEEQIQHLKNQGQENLKYAVQDYKGNLNIQLQQKRQQKLREMKEKIDQNNEKKRDKVRKELQAEFEQKKYELKKQYVIEEKALEQQEKIKIETEYQSEVSKLELKYIEELQKLKQSEEMYYLKKQDRLFKISQDMQQKYDHQEKEVLTNLERKIQKLEDEQLDLQSKLNTKKIYSKKYLELKNLEQQFKDDIKEQSHSIKFVQDQFESEKENLFNLQNQIQDKLQIYQKLISEQNQYNTISAQNIQERREQQLVEKVSKLKEDLMSIQREQQSITPNQIASNNYITNNNVLKNKDPNIISQKSSQTQNFLKANSEEDENSVVSKEKEQLKQLKRIIEQKLIDMNKQPSFENQYTTKQNDNIEDDSNARKKFHLIDNNHQQTFKRYASYDRAYQSQSQQGFYQDSKQQTINNFIPPQQKDDQISQLKLQLEQIKNQIIYNEQRKRGAPKQPPSITTYSKKRELSLDDFTNKRIATPIHQGTIQFNKVGDSSRQNSHNHSVQSSKLANYSFQHALKKDWKTIISLEFEKLKLEADGVKKDKEILSHQQKLTKDEIKSLRKGQNEFLLHSDFSRNLQNTVKNAEKVLKEKLIRLDNEKLAIQQKEVEVNQKKRILDNMQIKLETMQNLEEEDELESMYDEYKYTSKEDQQKSYLTSINNYYNENDQSVSYTIQKKKPIDQNNFKYKNRYTSLQPKSTYQHGLSFQEQELGEEDEEASQESGQEFEDNHSMSDENDIDSDKKYHISQQKIISNKYSSLQVPSRYNKLNQQVYIQGKMKPYQDLLQKYTLN